MQDNSSASRKSKAPSGAEKRRKRVERGLPAFTAKEQAARILYDEKRQATQVEAKATLVASIKVERGCTDCGYCEHPEALHFDHLPGNNKRWNISQMTASRHSKRRLLEEIAKCEVVCANCHAVRTYKRKRRQGH